MRLILSLSFSLSVFLGVVFPQEVAVIDPTPNDTSRKVTESLSDSLEKSFVLTDSQLGTDQIEALNFSNPFNLSNAETKNLGVRVGSDFIILVKAETLRRSEYGRPRFFESYFALYLLESRSGELSKWLYKKVEDRRLENAQAKALDLLPTVIKEVEEHIRRFYQAKRSPSPENFPLEQKYRPPKPYKRLRPEYTSLASRYSIAATIDALVTVNEKGDVERITIERWAGFGLEESVINNIKRMQWRPADSDGKPFTMSILLRYNFRDLENKEPS